MMMLSTTQAADCYRSLPRLKPDGQGGVTGVFELTGSSFTDEMADGVGWVRDQAETARIGSALAGRPLRIITPGFPVGTVNVGSDGDPDDPDLTNPADRAAYSIRETARFVNRNRMFFDIHLHYVLSEQWAEDRIDFLVDTNGPWSDDIPEGRVCLEWGPKGDDEREWWKPGGDHYALPEFPKYYRDNTNVTPLRGWEGFIKDRKAGGDDVDGWEEDQFPLATDGGFKLDALLGSFRSTSFAVGCYGPTLQRPNEVFGIACLLASRINKNDYGDPDYIADAKGFTPIKFDYEAAVGTTFSISEFAPHFSPTEDDKDKACPACN